MVRTSVGYAGGTQENPTYYNLGSHSETIQIDYDPTRITYEELLAVFWDSHNPTTYPWSRQYMSFIFYHNDEQERLAQATKEAEAARRGQGIVTEVAPYTGFYPAEDYHQKYYLQQDTALRQEFDTIYPDAADFVASTAAARINGYVGGYGDPEFLREELGSYGLSETGSNRLLELAGRGLRPGCAL